MNDDVGVKQFVNTPGYIQMPIACGRVQNYFTIDELDLLIGRHHSITPSLHLSISPSLHLSITVLGAEA